MFRAISSAFSLLLVLLILKMVVPDIFELIAMIIVKILTIANESLDQASSLGSSGI